MKEPKKGWHYTVCKICRGISSKVTHFGGKNKLRKCDFCSEEDLCFECIEKDGK